MHCSSNRPVHATNAQDMIVQQTTDAGLCLTEPLSTVQAELTALAFAVNANFMASTTQSRKPTVRFGSIRFRHQLVLVTLVPVPKSGSAGYGSGISANSEASPFGTETSRGGFFNNPKAPPTLPKLETYIQNSC